MTKMTNSIYVLGTGLSHDGSACLLKDGKICVAIEKERITRIKHDGYADNEAMQYCLDAEGITWDDIDLVVQNANFSNFDRGNAVFHGTPRIIPDSIRVETISHHLAHAYSVVGTCPFDELAIFIADGCGSSFDDCLDLEGAIVANDIAVTDAQHLSFEKDSYYYYKDGVLSSIYKDFSPFGHFLKGYSMTPPTAKHSIGGLYSAVSQYVFQGMEDPGKLMGLAPYGRPDIHQYKAFRLEGDRVFVNYEWMELFDRPRIRYEDLAENFQYYADIAYWMQREIEEILINVVNKRFELKSCKNLGFAGGLALNAVANAKLTMDSPFDNYYFQPAAADNGLSIGCAYYGWLSVMGKKRVLHDGSPYFGKFYSENATHEALAAYADDLKVSRVENTTSHVANFLSNGKVVAWFEKGSEFGPRALGHRSILADPRNPEIRDFINKDVKFREDFRPFAPSVPQDKVSIYFDCEADYESPYMIQVLQTRDEWKEKIPAVVHADGSARVQTVTQKLSPNYYKLIGEFGDKTGVYVLLNTSFNKKGMPIVETPEQALSFFMECALDVLVIDGCIIEKKHSKARAKTDERAEWDKGLGALYSENLGI